MSGLSFSVAGQWVLKTIASKMLSEQQLCMKSLDTGRSYHWGRTSFLLWGGNFIQPPPPQNPGKSWRVAFQGLFLHPALRFPISQAFFCAGFCRAKTRAIFAKPPALQN